MNFLAVMFRAEPVSPLVIWVVLLLLSAAALVLLNNQDGALKVLRTLASPRGGDAGREGRRQRAAEAARYAGEVEAAADRAGTAAGLWNEYWQRTAGQAEAAWQERQRADRRLARIRGAAAFAMPTPPRTPGEYADRERFLFRVVREAVACGDLPAGALDDAAAGRGWDARLHPAEQEVAVRQAIAAHRALLHRRAAEAEAAAWHDAQLALTVRDSLIREVRDAVARAAALHPAPRPRTRRMPAPARAAVAFSGA